LTAMVSIPRHQQPGPEEFPWPQPRPQLMRRTRQNVLQSEAAPTPAGNAINSPAADLEQEHGQSHVNRPSPPQHRNVAQPAHESPAREVPCEATDNSSHTRPMRDAPHVQVAPPQPPHPRVAFTADLPPLQVQSARNRHSPQTQAHQQSQAQAAQRPAARNANSAPSAGIRNSGGTIAFILPPLPIAAPAA